MTATAGWILHVDLDQFLAAVEVMRRPELRGRPVVVGSTSGDPTRRRAVVATASYEARAFGVRSGMPLRTAARRCPDAVFLASDPPVYEAASARVMATLRAFGVVEVWGWDEAFVGVHSDDPEGLAADIRHAVTAETGLSCSVGVGDTKQRAKIATGFAKPAGIYRLTADNWVAVMGRRPTAALWGIGAKTATNLAGIGLATVTDLAEADPATLAARFGPTIGPSLRQLALGGADTEVVGVPREPRSRSRETTYLADLTERSEIDERVATLARSLAHDVAAEGRRVARVAVKVRCAPFFTRTRITKLPEATSDPDAIERAALAVLDRFAHTRPVRLLGVRLEFAPTAVEPGAAAT